MPTARARNLDLEAAAFANPDDVDAWRVYADWLQSVGDSRGEIVSLSLHRREAFLSQRKGLAMQIEERQRGFVDEWREWAGARGLAGVKPHFDRGFVNGLVGPFAALVDHLDELFERDPIQRLTLQGVHAGQLMELCERAPSWAQRLRYLKLTGNVGALGAAALAQFALPKLEGLNLLATQLDNEACGHLANLDTEALARLVLTANEIDGEGLDLLLESPTRTQWRHLYLSQTLADSVCIRHIAQTDGLEKLEGLYMSSVEAQFSDFDVLLESDKLPSLKVLELPRWGSWRARALRAQMRERFGSGLKIK